MSNKILVIGSTGKTGKRVYAKLKEKNADVIPASRNSETPFDWYDASTWQAALKGINKVYLTFHPDLTIPQALPIIKDFGKAAAAANVKKIVLLSGRGEKEAQECENAVIASGLDWTIIRSAFFMQNFSEGFWADGINTGEFLIPIVKAKEPFVDADDIADMVVSALLEEKHNGKIYETTGPELISIKEAAGKIAKALNKEIKVIEVPLEEYASILRSYQLPEDVVAMLIHLFDQVLDGRNESVNADIPTVLGRKATTFDEYAKKTIHLWK